MKWLTKQLTKKTKQSQIALSKTQPHMTYLILFITKFFYPDNSLGIDSIASTNKLKFIKDSIKQWYTPPKLSRRQDIAMTRTKIGHTFLTHFYLFTKDLLPICNICNTTITIKYIFEL